MAFWACIGDWAYRRGARERVVPQLRRSLIESCDTQSSPSLCAALESVPGSVSRPLQPPPFPPPISPTPLPPASHPLPLPLLTLFAFPYPWGRCPSGHSLAPPLICNSPIFISLPRHAQFFFFPSINHGFVKTLTGKTITRMLSLGPTRNVKAKSRTKKVSPDQRLIFMVSSWRWPHSFRLQYSEGGHPSCSPPAWGGYDPTLAALAKKSNCDRMICRKCYARLPARAKNCRKKKCDTRSCAQREAQKVITYRSEIGLPYSLIILFFLLYWKQVALL